MAKERCLYPACNCVVSTSTSRPVPDCPRGLKRPATTAKPKAPKAAEKERDVRKTTKKKAAPPRAAVKGSTDKSAHSPLAVGEFICRDGGCTMAELVKKFGVEAHPMRAKIHAAKHQLGFKIEYDHEAKRYSGTAPKQKAAA